MQVFTYYFAWNYILTVYAVHEFLGQGSINMMM